MLNRSIIIAHRGESFDAPENTLASINLAWQRKADAVEIDVHLTADNQIVVIHDRNTKRISGVYKKVSAQTFESLRKLDVGSYKGNQWKDQKIPLLEEVLDIVPRGKQIFIEIKCGKDILPPISKVIKRSKLKSEQIKLIGFNFKTMSLSKIYIPKSEVFWLRNSGRSALRFWKSNEDEIISRTLEKKLNGLDIKWHKLINKDLVDRIKSTGLKLFIWTVNDYKEADRLIQLGVDGVTTDRPQWIKEKLSVKKTDK